MESNSPVNFPIVTSHFQKLLYASIRGIPDFPKPGVLFRDITPILQDPQLYAIAIRCFVEACSDKEFSKIVGIDARGFLFATTVAHQLNVGFVPIRKKGKLPHKTHSIPYQLEYGQAELEVHQDAFNPRERVILIDDLLATGGTARAAIELIIKAGAVPVEAQFLIELTMLNGRENLSPLPVYSVLSY